MSIYNDNKIKMQDYEGIKYPDLDTKRAVIDKMLADKLNEVFRLLDDIEKRHEKWIGFNGHMIEKNFDEQQKQVDEMNKRHKNLVTFVATDGQEPDEQEYKIINIKIEDTKPSGSSGGSQPTDKSWQDEFDDKYNSKIDNKHFMLWTERAEIKQFIQDLLDKEKKEERKRIVEKIKAMSAYQTDGQYVAGFNDAKYHLRKELEEA